MRRPQKPRPTRHSGVLDAQAECADCPWTSTQYKNALATAARHAQTYGHTVRVEQTIGVTYNKKIKDPQS